MKKIVAVFSLIFLTLTSIAQTHTPRVLVFFKTARYYHESIQAGITAIQKLGKQHHFDVDTTADSTRFTERNIKKYAAVIFLSTTGDVFDTAQKAVLERYIQAGGGYMGIHSASTTEKNWTWYGHLVGAVFTDHPEAQEGVVVVIDGNNPATSQLPKRWKRKDEWYNFRDIVPGLHILLTVDETTYKGGKHGAYHPEAWYHQFDGGRSFYTALGHFTEDYSDPLFVQHLLAGIRYAIGDHVVLDYSKSRAKLITH